ncbi:MAG: cytochrome b [Pseudomonadota bacterium]
MNDRYTNTAISLHWLIALLLFISIPLGVYMHDLPLSPYKLQLYSYHKWIGVTIFMLAVFRLYWRISHRPPALPENTPQWAVVASEIVHYLLYILILIIPLSGWLMSSAKGFQTVWFGLLPLPDLLGKDKFMGDLLQGVHQFLNIALAVVFAAHVGAALKHHFLERDDILSRMLPFLRKKT